MRPILIATVIVLLQGQDRPIFSKAATEADARAVAMESVKAREKWKRVGSTVTKKLDTEWRVFVARLPSNFGTPYVLVTVDGDGQVTGYEKRNFGM